MYLKSLELYGFKSFPDRVKIDFGSGSTGIVGPNGSGKSNISDAIRWVLGEQSSKMLRGNKTEDVVFSGTEKRKPLGMAEVSLVFDNTAHFLKSDADEVTITRRYYLSGESEYRINKKQVRLKDVRELFMDTGLGRDGYSVIGQGKIDEILSQKSEDRREIFEEAAGISKYRVRKEEAERKLTNAADNLTRLADIISELEVQIVPLEKKAARAATYLLLHDELRDLETDIWSERLEELKTQMTKASGNLKICETMLAESRISLERFYQEAEEATEAVAEGNSKAEMLRQTLREQEASLSELDADAAAAGANVQHLESQKTRLSKELTEKESTGEQYRQQLQKNLDDLAQLEQQKMACEDRLNQLYAQSETLAREIGDSARQLEGLRAEEAILHMDIEEAKNDLSAVQTLSSELEMRQSEEADGLATARSELETEQATAATVISHRARQQEKVDELRNAWNGYQLLVKRRETASKETNDEKLRLTMEVSNLTSRHKMLSDLQRDYEGYSKAVKTLMQLHSRGTMPGICGTVGELIRVNPEHTLAIETALGGALQNVVTRTEEDAKAAIEYLKRSDAGRATFLPVSAIRGNVLQENGLSAEPGFVGIAVELCTFEPTYTGIFHSLLGRTAVFDSLDSAVRTAKKRGHRFRIVTLDGQVINAGGSMTGGSAGRNTGILSRANDIQKLEENLRTLTEQKKQAEKRVEEAERRLKEVRYQLTSAEDEIRSAEDQLLSLNLAVQQQEKLILSGQEKVETLSRNRERTRERAAELERQAVELQNRIRELTAHMDELREKTQTLSGQQSDSEQQRNTLSESITDERVRLASLTTQTDYLCATVETVKKQIADAQMAGRDVQSEMEKITDDLRRLKEEQTVRTARQAECRNAIHTLEADVERLQKQRMADEARKTESDANARTVSERVIQMEREYTRLETIVNDGEQERKRISDQMWEQYELTPGEAAARAKPVENRAQVQRRIAELKSKKRALGDVDTGAIDELKQLKERYAYLTAQQADLAKSTQELTDLIDGITNEMKTLFETTFDEVSESFGTVFREIFGGGRAELVLADRSDVLNCGIEIHVQPPGKSLKILSLLSGGEKALVAIALYFSILRIRPAPFCVLDEIDAALDEKNVARFAAYLNRFAQKTQFILITHRRGTMEIADRIYGITMQEQGISKVIPLDMAEVEKRFMKQTEGA